MAALSFGIAPLRSFTHSFFVKTSRPRISCVWDPEGLFKTPPQTGHIARLEFKKRIEKDSEAKEAYERHLREEKDRREAIRQSRVIPDTDTELIEYFLDTEAQEIEFEIARLRPRLNEGFFKQLQSELGQLRFAMAKTEEMEDRIFELETLQKALLEGTEAYDKLQNDLVKAKQSLAKIFTSKDVNVTLLEMVEQNELNMSLVTLLDENIASAHRSNQKQAAEYMEKLRTSVVKYVTV
ncbi:uncharacterized protein LOC130801223 [Amaranthus tricolor]|uniref:uncharacterized protein LOC130801223 n=1 Tax=Amaranthus tricolor TaxID=29722 RepID=UPI00258EA8DD|nr:uncharacterized protein LOC130801223 [Amaranthus tricolor]